MSVASLVEELARRGLRLSVESGELKCRGPKSALTPEVLAQLRARKAEVIAHLRPEAPTVSLPRVTPAAVERVLRDPPPWLVQLFALFRSGTETPIKLSGGPSGGVETYMVLVSIANICAAVAAEVGMPVLEWERIRPDVKEALGSWEGA